MPAQIRSAYPRFPDALTPRDLERHFTLSDADRQLAAGVALALFLEFLNNTIKSVEDVTEHLGLPTLAIVPSLGKKEQPQLQSLDPTSITPDALTTPHEKFTPRIGNLMINNDRSAFAEAYRAIRNSILLASAGTPLRHRVGRRRARWSLAPSCRTMRLARAETVGDDGDVP